MQDIFIIEGAQRTLKGNDCVRNLGPFGQDVTGCNLERVRIEKEINSDKALSIIQESYKNPYIAGKRIMYFITWR